MTKKSRLRRWMLRGVGISAGLFCVLAVISWPRMFVSEGRELTGASIELRELARFDRASREGSAATVYRIGEGAALALAANKTSLKRYPMWSARAFDGYKRVRWQTMQELKSGPDRLFVDWVFLGITHPTAVDAEKVSSLDEVRALAASLSQPDGVLLCGWYTGSDDVVTNYVAYILDLKRRLLIKLSLLT